MNVVNFAAFAQQVEIVPSVLNILSVDFAGNVSNGVRWRDK